MKSKRVLLWVVVMLTGLFWMPYLSMAQINQAVTQTEEEYFHLLRANQLSGQVNAEDILRARQQLAGMNRLKQGAALDLSWDLMGPDNVAGRTRAVLIDKNNPAVIYAAAVTGGIWKSLSGGTSWVPTKVNNETDNILNATCMVQAPNGTIFAGTGEGQYSGTGTGTGGIVGRGLFKSTDGENFSVIAGTEPLPNSTTADWAYINKLAVSPDGRLFLAGNKGLKYSDDEGASWNYAQAGGLNLNGNALDVKIAASGLVTACVAGECYISEDGNPGGFVSQSTGQAGKLPLPVNVGRIEMAIAPSDNNIIYAVVVKPLGALQGIYRSADKGANWQLIGPGGSPSFNIFNISTDVNTGTGNYACTIAVFPDNPNQILVGGVNMWKGVKMDEGYFSWEQVSDGIYLPELFPLYAHISHHAYVFHPTNSNMVYLATDGGVSLSTNGAQTFQSMNKNYMVAQAYTVGTTYKGEVLFGTQGAGVQLIDFQGNTSKSATAVTGGIVGGSVAASSINTKAYFVGTTNGLAYRSIDNGENLTAFYASEMTNLNGALVTPFVFWESFNDPTSIDSAMFVSYDTILPGQTFIVKSKNGDYPFVVTNSGPTIFPKDTVYVNDPVASKFFLGVNGAVWYTKKALDFTATPPWVKLANFTGVVQSLAVTNNGDVLFMGLQNGLLLRVRNITTYEADTAIELEVDTILIKPGRVFTSLAVNPGNNNHLIVTLGNYGNNDYIYESMNATADLPEFSNKQGNLPAMPVYTSLIEMNTAGRVIIGTDLGVFSTANIGAGNPNWSFDGEGMGNLPVMDLIQQTQTHWPLMDENDSAYVTNIGMIYAASHGRGVFKCGKFVSIQNPENPAHTSANLLGVYPNPVTAEATVTYTLASNSPVTMQVLTMQGQVVRELALENQSKGNHSFSFVMDKEMKSGTYIIRLLTASGQQYGRFILVK